MHSTPVVLWLLVAATATASPLPRTGYASFLPGLTEYPAYGAPYPAYGAPYAGYEPPPPVRIVEQRQPPQRLPHPPAPLPDSAVAAPAAQSQVTLQLTLTVPHVLAGSSIDVAISINGKPVPVGVSPPPPSVATPPAPVPVETPPPPPVATPPAPAPIETPPPSPVDEEEPEEIGSIAIDLSPDELLSNIEEGVTDRPAASVVPVDESAVQFPGAIATPAPDESALMDREPAAPVAPGGIISSNQPTFLTPTSFQNPKDSPLLIQMLANVQ